MCFPGIPCKPEDRPYCGRADCPRIAPAYSEDQPADPMAGYKPRLPREHQALLESEYQQCRKPNRYTKRALAQSIGVDTARINIWFQNRRAREKMEAKMREYEQNQRLKGLGTDGRPCKDDGVSKCCDDQFSDTSSVTQLLEHLEFEPHDACFCLQDKMLESS